MSKNFTNVWEKKSANFRLFNDDRSNVNDGNAPKARDEFFCSASVISIPNTGICVRQNYTPRKTQPKDNREYWHYSYLSQLIDMYNITVEVITKRYPERKFNWNSQTKFNNLSRLIHHCSSQYISPYLENKSKEWEDMNKNGKESEITERRTE